MTKDNIGRENGNRVLSVVPSDPALRLIGWVELDSRALSADAIREKKFKGRLIRRKDPPEPYGWPVPLRPRTP